MTAKQAAGIPVVHQVPILTYHQGQGHAPLVQLLDIAHFQVKGPARHVQDIPALPVAPGVQGHHVEGQGHLAVQVALLVPHVRLGQAQEVGQCQHQEVIQGHHITGQGHVREAGSEDSDQRGLKKEGQGQSLEKQGQGIIEEAGSV